MWEVVALTVRVAREADSRACIVTLDGEVDLAVVPEVRDELEAVIGAGCSEVVLDLTAVTYADSTALGLLVWLDRKLLPIGGKLLLCGANRDVARILELSGLIGVAPTISARATLAEALSSVDFAGAEVEPEWTETLSAPAEIETLASTRMRVIELLQPLSLDDSALFDIKVAVGEALANAVRHGSPGGADDEIAVSISAYGDRISVSVADSGCGFDGAPASSDDVYASSGRGIMFMRALMDSVQFVSCEGGGTMVTLVKSIGGDA
jgi:anti-anti-sigma factor